MPPGVIIGVVVFLLVLAALCLMVGMWTIVNDLRAAGNSPTPWSAPSFCVLEVPPALPRPSVPLDLAVTPTLFFAPRRFVPPGVPFLPAPLPRGMIHATPLPGGRDEEDEDDYTEVEDGVTMIRDLRVAARR